MTFHHSDMNKQEDALCGTKMVFILGITQRSGTNYLNNLLLLHPDCDYPGIVWEDYLVAHAELLNSYAESVYQHWQPAWRERLVRSMGRNPVMQSLGTGLVSFFKEQFKSESRTGSAGKGSPEMLVSATPSIRSLDYFFDLFPEAYLLIIVRDGRAVVESGVKSFDWDYEHAMRNWASAAKKIIQFDHAMSSKNRKYLILKYEDLCIHTREKMKEVIGFLKLDAGRYDFDAAENLAVTGSSELRDSEGIVHWRARKKPENFDPINRWKHWGRSLHERFNWVAGIYCDGFGYDKKITQSNNFMWKAWNVVLDYVFKLEMILQQKRSFAFPFIKKLRGILFSNAISFGNRERQFEKS